jgi:hypothetical protein
MSGREVRARSVSGPDVPRSKVTATAVSAALAGGSIGGQRQAAKRENGSKREDCSARHVLPPFVLRAPLPEKSRLERRAPAEPTIARRARSITASLLPESSCE